MNRALRVLTAIMAITVPAIAIASPARAAPVNGSQTSNDQGSQGDDHGDDDGSQPDYPPRSPMLTTPTPTTTPGAHLTLIATGFAPGATIKFTISGRSEQHSGHDRNRHGGRARSRTLGTQVADASGAATLETSAPNSSGRYRVTASSHRDRASLSLLVKGQRPRPCRDDSRPPSRNSSDRGDDCRDDSHSMWSKS